MIKKNDIVKRPRAVSSNPANTADPACGTPGPTLGSSAVPSRSSASGAPSESGGANDFVTIWLDGEPIRARRREPVAVALHRSGHKLLGRSLKYHRPRGAFCYEGHCGQCLMRIGGLPSMRSCMVPAASDLACERQSGFPTADADLLSAANWLFPKGMDHHTLLMKAPLLHPLLHSVVRRLGGVGKLPTPTNKNLTAQKKTATSVRRRLTTDLLVIGGGPAGLACGRAAATSSATSLGVVVVDEQPVPGGMLLTTNDEGGRNTAGSLAEEIERAGGQVLAGTNVFGWYPEDDGGIFAAVRFPCVQAPDGELIEIAARKVVHATGVYAQNLLCENNDVPGVIAGRALGRLIHLYGYVPGSSFALVGPPSERRPVAETLRQLAPDAALFECDQLDSIGEDGEKLEAKTGDSRTFVVDTVVACQLGLPATELARSQGVAVKPWRERFAIDCDNAGRTRVANVYACGEATGIVGAAASLAMGDAVGRAIAHGDKLATDVASGAIS